MLAEIGLGDDAWERLILAYVLAAFCVYVLIAGLMFVSLPSWGAFGLACGLVLLNAAAPAVGRVLAGLGAEIDASKC